MFAIVNRHALEDSVLRTANGHPAETLGEPQRLDYVALSQAALRRIPIAKRLLGLVTSAQVDPTSALILAAPEFRGDWPDRIRPVMASLFRGGGRLPMAVAANVVIANADLAPEALQKLGASRRLIIDDADSFWRRSPAFYQAFDEIIVLSRRRRHIPSPFHTLMSAAYGPRARIEWLVEAQEAEHDRA